ncbi:MAG: hypothetical protein KIT09_20100 [Bryobacteraceae bacterium]|nr:hypothetical protein [Bryobacteraceae bacterium]
MERQKYLVEANIALLRQALELLGRIDEAAYRAPSHRVGGHLRHILEFYQCAIEGFGNGAIDYDARKRNRAIETDKFAAEAAIRSLLRQLDGLAGARDEVIWVSIEDAGDELPGERMASSVSRELQFLRSHTIHHFAVMTPDLRTLGTPLDETFGMAPSTLRYLASRRRPEVQLCAR